MSKPHLHPRLGAFVTQAQATAVQRLSVFAWAALIAGSLAVIALVSWTGGPRYAYLVPPAAFALALTFHGSTSRRGITLYEDGVVIRGEKNRERAVPLEDVRGVTWAEAESPRGHRIARKVLTLILRSGERLAVQQDVRRADAMFDAVRDFIARRLARELDLSLRRDGQVEWVPGVRIAEDGLRLGTAPPLRAVARPRTLRHELREGRYRLFFDDAPAPVLDLASDADNLLPGMMLVEALWARPG